MSSAVARIAGSDADIMRCFPVMHELRTHLRKEEFLATVRRMQQEGFRLAFLEQQDRVVAVAGYRIHTNLFLGRNLYVDDLVTSAGDRSAGHGRTLLGWLRGVARDAGCRHLHLDSGVQRKDAHRFYFREGLGISSYHFSEELDPA